MPRLRILIVVGALALLAAGAAWSQDEVMTLDSKALGPHQRPLVTFQHEKHSQNMECQTCHHDYDKYMNNNFEDGAPCAKCHQPRATAKNRVPLRLAFHQECKGCHNTLLERGTPAGPVMCGQCHVRGGKAAKAGKEKPGG
jgi:hypothetical protein